MYTNLNMNILLFCNLICSKVGLKQNDVHLFTTWGITGDTCCR